MVRLSFFVGGRCRRRATRSAVARRDMHHAHTALSATHLKSFGSFSFGSFTFGRVTCLIVLVTALVVLTT